MKRRINLYSAEYRPQRLWASLPHMLAIWGLGLLVLVGSVGWGQHSLSQLRQQQAMQQQRLLQQQQQQQALQTALAKRQADAALKLQLDSSQQELAARQALASALNGRAGLRSGGFSMLLSDLARIHDPRIALSRIQISSQGLALEGASQKGEYVPAWIARFPQMPSLRQRHFAALQLQRGQDGLVHFTLGSATDREKRP